MWWQLASYGLHAKCATWQLALKRVEDELATKSELLEKKTIELTNVNNRLCSIEQIQAFNQIDVSFQQKVFQPPRRRSLWLHASYATGHRV